MMLVKIIFSIFVLLGVFPAILVADADPTIERLPLTEITVSGSDGESVIELGVQTIIEVGYTVNYPNLEYVILFLITDEDNQAVSLSWIEGFQDELTDRPRSYVCGDDICFDKHASSESYVCGNDMCEYSNTYNSKFVQTSWYPSESGTYEITAFAWEGIDNPTAYSPPRSVEVTVVENVKPSIQKNENHTPLNIASIEDDHILLYPVDTCAGIDVDRLTLDELNQRYPATYTTKSGKTYEIKFLSINDDDLKGVPIISELIIATHQIPFPLNNGITAYKGLVEDPDWINYQEWYDQKKTEQFNLDEVRVRGFVYNEEYYGIGFSIC